MQGVDPVKAAQLGALFASMGDADLAALGAGLDAGDDAPANRAAREALSLEQHSRRVRDQVFAPLKPSLDRAAHDPAAPAPRGSLELLWRTLRADPGAAPLMAAALADDSDDETGCLSAAALANYAFAAYDADGPWAKLRAALDAARPGAAELRACLALTPLLRATLPRFQAWKRSASAEHAPALKLAYRDAAGLGDAAPPLLLDLLADHLEHRWQALRLVSAVMGRPAEGFLAVSELARFGVALLDDIDARILAVKAFDPAQGGSAGRRAADLVCGAVAVLGEFDRNIELRPDGPWSQRLMRQRRDLARTVEARLKQAEEALARALPVVTSSLSQQARGLPKLDVAVEPAVRQKAEALIVFAVALRPGADTGGYSMTRTGVLESLDRRLGAHADDLVRAVHEAPAAPAAAEARSRLAFVADCLGVVRDRKAAEILRRRVACA